VRKRVAREAAVLLYTSQEKEFKQAKERAAESLGARVLPSNLEVAEELDRIADEFEGPERQARLIRMRREALRLMETLERFQPRLIGSVWRGTARRNSDIDIEVFSADPESVLEELRGRGFEVVEVERVTAARNEGVVESTHIYLTLESGEKTEVIIRSPEEVDKERLCEIYGDPVRGLGLEGLRRVLREDPLKRFVP
jgi:predicted nucleotidyltransferase